MVDWFDVVKNIGFYASYFVFYTLLLLTSFMAFIGGLSSINHETDSKALFSQVMGASMLWAIYILINAS